MIPYIQSGHHIFDDFLIGDVAYDGTNRLGDMSKNITADLSNPKTGNQSQVN
jgi:hypothetical protein